MIRRSKLQPTDDAILIFDVRSKSIALNTNREPKVFLGRIYPTGHGWYRWQSRWGGNQGELPTIEMCEEMIVRLSKNMYR